MLACLLLSQAVRLAATVSSSSERASFFFLLAHAVTATATASLSADVGRARYFSSMAKCEFGEFLEEIS